MRTESNYVPSKITIQSYMHWTLENTKKEHKNTGKAEHKEEAKEVVFRISDSPEKNSKDYL